MEHHQLASGSQLYLREPVFTPQSPRPLLSTGSVSHFSCHLAQKPSSLLSLPLARLCLYLCKSDSKASRHRTYDPKASRLKACRDEVRWNSPFLNVLRPLSWLL